MMKEGMVAARLLMVLSSISPLFVLWAARGVSATSKIPEPWLLTFCAVFVFVPNFFLWLRVRTAIKLKEKRELVTGKSDDHRDHLLVYLFAMLLPFFAEKLETWRDVFATLTALAFIVYLFWHLNLHYMNIVFAWRGFRVFTIYPRSADNNLSGTTSWVLITRRPFVAENETVIAYRISDTVYLELTT